MAEQSWIERVKAWPAATRSFIDEINTEMRRVTWPSWKQVRATTAVVIAAVFAFAAYFAVVDLLIGRGINRVFDVFSR
jgi:preprotein translocase subunit SecE